MSQPGDRRPMVLAPAAAVAITTQLMIAAVIFLFMMVVFIFFLYLYTKYYYMGSTPRRPRLVFASAEHLPSLPLRGLDAAALKSLPVTVFRQADFKEAVDCAVCLSELADGEQARILPRCGHGFHVECVDMWLRSHTTCPLCRAPVAAAAPPLALPRERVSWPESLRFPVADPREGTSRRPEGALVIDIPRRAVDGIVSPLPTSSFPMEEKTPRSARLTSFRRLLSMGKMVVGSSCSPRGGDIEQGLVGGGVENVHAQSSNGLPIGYASSHQLD